MMAMSKSMLEHQEPGDLEALLPWYAAGTLSARDTRRVAEALERDPDLAKQYAAVLEEYASTIELNESLGVPSSRAMQKLFSAIDAEPARSAQVGFKAAGRSFGTRFASFVKSLSPKVLTWSASLASTALVVQAGLIGAMLVWSPGGVLETGTYQPQYDRAPAPRNEAERVQAPPAPAPASPPAAAAPPVAAPAPGPSLSAPAMQRAAPLTRSLGGDISQRVFVRFAPDARISDITALLDSYQASVIDSSKGGVFRLQLAGAKSQQDQARLIARLEKEPLVTMALPAP
ncbi:hypothetical protein LPW26_01195 [Rhodopseudomonas sp. HC1]|uniref:hypothetical protein n=1 Tax=Rhodopseudomonas infernalis TaxID=2897386 RepID=UPI001EE98AF3|nr:hypothetical protein [Rhodopseudomonas infernalis]MCG6203239.1 hypothetical protein [Rhodopseudomonas infernalis]